MDRESPDYYVERTDESVPDTEKLIEYIRSLSLSKGMFYRLVPKSSRSHRKHL